MVRNFLYKRVSRPSIFIEKFILSNALIRPKILHVSKSDALLLRPSRVLFFHVGKVVLFEHADGLVVGEICWMEVAVGITKRIRDRRVQPR